MKCTPGGTFLDGSVEREAAAKSSLSISPAVVVIAVGTNDTGRQMVMERAEKHFKALLSSWHLYPSNFKYTHFHGRS